MPELATSPAPRRVAVVPPVGVAVHSVATSLPERVVANAPIAARLGVSDKWIVSRTGVHQRHVAAEGELLYGFAAEAAAGALDAAGVEPEEVDLVIVATMTHEQLTPSASALVAAEIGASRAGAIDLNAACTGFVSALGAGAAQIESGRMETVLVVGADLMASILDPDDRTTAALFGDGAGAVVLTATDPPGGIGPLTLGADGGNAGLVRALRSDSLLRMKGHDTFRHAVDRLCEATLTALEEAGMGIEEVDLFAYHQANSRIIAAVGEKLDLPAERVIDCVASYGNTSAASIPLALAAAADEGRLHEGSRVLLAAFGGGLTWGATTIVWGRGDG